MDCNSCIESAACPINFDLLFNGTHDESKVPATDFIKWLHGLSAVLAVSICSIFGAFILPLLQKNQNIFEYTMVYLMALAVSALSGAAMLVLLPEGLYLEN